MARTADGPAWNVDYWQIAGAGYFETLGIPLKEGRFFTAADAMGGPGVAIVNEAMARRFWPDQSPIGRRVKAVPQDTAEWLTIVGVVGDVNQQGLGRVPGTELCLPLSQFKQATGFVAREVVIVVRSAGPDPMGLLSPIRTTVAGLDPTLPISNVRTMHQVFDESLTKPRFLMTLLVAFAGVALLLAAIGIYGVLSHSVAQRTSEIGIRLALGASRAAVAQQAVGQGMFLAGVGVVIGLLGSLALLRLIQSLLYDVASTDRTTYVAVAALAVGVALLACIMPALRAMRINPIDALREE
jgi:putative ABC transport system permease protein